MSLTGCSANTNNSDNNVSNSPKESVELSGSNFSKYVAVNSTAAIINNAYNDVIYYSYFIGADYCKFVNCSVTYTYAQNGGATGANDYTVSLSLSGDGQADPYFVRNTSAHVYYSIVIKSASGTVEVYR